jgi:biopolymer transport protein ExbD
MGASISGSEKGTRRRGLNADLNLIPFIDLLSVCITFLLLTAVWTQVQALAIDQGVADDATEATDADLPLTLHLTADGIWVGRDAARGTTFPIAQGVYAWRGVLAAVRADRGVHPAAADAVIVTDDGVAYEHMIRALDLTRAEGYTKTAISGDR